MKGQMNWFEYEAMQTTDWAKIIADGLIKHCDYWNMDSVEQFRKEPSTQNFFRQFCKVTKTYFIQSHGDIYSKDKSIKRYEVVFEKDENVTIKRIGTNFDKRKPDAKLTLQEVINKLMQ